MRDDGLDPVAGQPVAQPLNAIALVTRQFPGMVDSWTCPAVTSMASGVPARLICSASMIRANKPVRRQVEKYRYIVCHGPNRWGKSRQGAPVA
jgi:hypothetical protein